MRDTELEMSGFKTFNGYGLGLRDMYKFYIFTFMKFFPGVDFSTKIIKIDMGDGVSKGFPYHDDFEKCITNEMIDVLTKKTSRDYLLSIGKWSESYDMSGDEFKTGQFVFNSMNVFFEKSDVLFLFDILERIDASDELIEISTFCTPKIVLQYLQMNNMSFDHVKEAIEVRLYSPSMT